MTASVALVSLAAAGLVLASRADGLPPTHADLNDGGVWVTNSSESNGLLARFFVPVDQQDVPKPGLGAGFDVLQLGSDVLLVNGQGDLLPWKAVDNAPEGDVRHLGAASSVSLGGEESSDPAQSRSVTAILEQSTGALRIVSTKALPTFDVTKTTAVRTLGANARVVVAPDGSVVALSAQDHQLLRFAPGSLTDPAFSPVSGDLSGAELSLSTVGTGSVVLDPSTQKLMLPDGHVESVAGFGNRLALQQPGPDAASVLIGTAQGLVEVPLGHGPAHLLGDPMAGVDSPHSVVAPIRLPSGCARGAVVTSQSVELLDAECPGRPNLTVRELKDQQGEPFDAGKVGSLVFRVNHGLSLLNDTDTGAVWNPDDVVLRQRQDWTKDVQQSKTLPKTDPTRTKPQPCKPPGAVNSLPVVQPDQVGARAGIPVVVDVLRNDRDPDCDVLAIDGQGISVSPQGSGSAALVGDGRRLQVTPKQGASTLTVSYFVTDGRNGRVATTLSVHVVSSENPPRLAAGTTNPTTTAIRGKSVSYNVLGDWVDPDGDPLQLISASVAGGEGDVVFQPDGLLTYTDGGSRVGKVTISVGVSDGQRTTYGKLIVDVQPPGTDLKPIARDDYARGVAGQPIEMHLLANDADPNGNALHIGKVRVVSASGASASSLVVDSSNENRTVLSLDPKALHGAPAASFALEYDLFAGQQSAVGRARVDIVAAGTNRPPAPQVDVAAVRVGTSTEVDVLRNDVDPDGDVLAVSGVDTHGNDQVVLAGVEGSAFVRIQLLQAITTPVQITYSVTDGRSSPVPCVIVVSPAPTQSVVQQPVARPDTVTVRAGSMVAIPVLRNDSANSGGELVLSHRLAEQPASGTAYVDGDLVRYLAPSKAGVDSLSYSVSDSGDATRPSVGRVAIQILPADTKNHLPQPLTVSGRAVRAAGSGAQQVTVTIPVPLTGVDPDGDQVVIDNPDVADEFHNRVTLAPSGDSILYTPVASRTGTEHVRYRVCDVRPDRACAEGLLQVAVFSRASNDPPTTTPDTAVMLPGHTVSVDVVSNDVDPDGDSVLFAKPGLGTLPQGFSATTADGGRLTVTAPKTEGTYTITYFVTDKTHAATPVAGALTVTVDPTAPLQPPIARDDVVSWQDVADATKSGSSTVKVDVLANDSDPDGPASQLHVQAVQGVDGASPSPDKKFMLVTLGSTWRTVAYEAVDADGKTAVAFIAVPPSGNAPPVQASVAPREVKPGATLSLPVSDFAVDPDAGPSPLSFVLTSPARASAGSVKFDTDTSLTVTAPAMPAQGQPPATLDVSALVTDGKAQVLLHATVTVLVGNRPPSFSTPTVIVERVVGGPPTTVSLLTVASVTDPDAADAGTRPVFTASGGSTSGVDWKLADSGDLTLTPTEKATPGTSFPIKVHVADSHGAGNDGVVQVKVVTTTKPPLVASALTEAHVDQGGSIVVDVVGKNTDPFQGTSKPLSIVPAGVHVSTGDATATVEGGSIRITAGESAKPGMVVVAYRITDAALRTSDSTIRVPLWGKPDAPTHAVVVATTGSTVSLSWTPGATNITSANPDDSLVTYTVSSPGVPDDVVSTPGATIKGLTPGQPYTFTIKEHNSVGDSVTGASIGPVVPDAVPPAPVVRLLTDPTTFDKDRLTLVWDQPAPPDGASAIQQYRINYGSAHAGALPTLGGVTYGSIGHQVVLTGLTMGDAYNITLCPENKATVATGTVVCSDPPAQGVPIGIPADVTGLTANGLNATSTNTVVTATWAPVTGTSGMGGDTSVTYRCTLLDSGGSAVGAPTTTAGASCSLAAVAGSKYKVKVETGNAKGWSSGASSLLVAARGAPGTVQGLKAKATGAGQQLTITYSPPADDGCSGKCTPLNYEYNIDGGGWSPLSGSGATISVASNGVAYSIGVRANNAMEGAGTGVTGSAATVTSEVAYGDPAITSLGASNPTSNQIQWSWTVAANGHPVNVAFQVDGGGWNGAPGVGGNLGSVGGSYTGTFGLAQGHTLTVQVCDNVTGRCITASNAASTRTPSIVVRHGNPGGCAGCYWIVVELHNFAPNATYSVGVSNAQGNWLPTTSATSVYTNFTTDGQGNVTKQVNWFYGYPTGWVQADTGGYSNRASPWGA